MAQKTFVLFRFMIYRTSAFSYKISNICCANQPAALTCLCLVITRPIVLLSTQQETLKPNCTTEYTTYSRYNHVGVLNIQTKRGFVLSVCYHISPLISVCYQHESDRPREAGEDRQGDCGQAGGAESHQGGVRGGAGAGGAITRAARSPARHHGQSTVLRLHVILTWSCLVTDNYRCLSDYARLQWQTLMTTDTATSSPSTRAGWSSLASRRTTSTPAGSTCPAWRTNSS